MATATTDTARRKQPARSPRKGRPTKEQAQALHAGILEAATDLFTQEGFSTSMDAVATHAKVSKRTLYAHYPSKQHLYEAALTWLSGDLAKPATVLAGDLPLDEALMKFSASLLELYTRPKVVAFAQLIQKESSRFPELDAASRRQFDDNILQPLKSLLDRRPEIDPAAVNTAIMAKVLCSVATAEIARMHAQNALDERENFRFVMKNSIHLILNGAVGTHR
ncbi:MAG: helix-turn-helix domain containing protein [Novosphingobium sp.]|nr:helix-turn-helix domain containing protein [Novosphingobium sp.]